MESMRTAEQLSEVIINCINEFNDFVETSDTPTLVKEMHELGKDSPSVSDTEKELRMAGIRTICHELEKRRRQALESDV